MNWELFWPALAIGLFSGLLFWDRPLYSKDVAAIMAGKAIAAAVIATLFPDASKLLICGTLTVWESGRALERLMSGLPTWWAEEKEAGKWQHLYPQVDPQPSEKPRGLMTLWRKFSKS